MAAIKAKCKDDCCAGNLEEWKSCHIISCPLWPYRLGKNPNRKGIGGNPKIKDLKKKP
jgi:hypothetical protein